jgi:pyrroline-5-carboxylate reductase
VSELVKNSGTLRAGLIGCGSMGTALARGMVRESGLGAANLMVYDVNRERLDNLVNELGVQPAVGIKEVCRFAEIIFLAVKPLDIAGLVDEIRNYYHPGQILVSVAAGIPISSVAGRLPVGGKVIRLMPNTPCLVGEGAIAICAGEHVADDEVIVIEELLRPLGLVERVNENLMNAVTGLSGSGPAYLFLFIEALIDGGVEAGLPRPVAARLAAQTVQGAVKMLKAGDRHPAELRNAVTSPGGTTSAALSVFEQEAFRGTIIKAVLAAAKRAGELESDG